MNHRTTSACNCISVPIINVSTATLFTKAVIIKSQVGEIWNTNAYLKKPFLCNSVSKYQNSNFAVVYELSWGVCFWNSILNWFLGVWFPVRALSVTHGFLRIFWIWTGGAKAEIVQIFLTNLSSDFWTHCQGGRKGVLYFHFNQECLFSKQKTRITDFPHPSHSHKPSPPGNCWPLNCLRSARTFKKY